ncbi:MAG: hypothetical protein IK151_04495 [Erysipelotrichaceae bacterium]|nr:hypothetical protein [Erysipelotrichaceae bacterium]
MYKKEDFNIKTLGCFYSRLRTVFRVFAPDYNELKLIIKNHEYKMHRKGACFEIALCGNLELQSYHYEGDGISFADPFAYLALNDESIVLDTKKFNNEAIVPDEVNDPIIYECSVRDFSADDSYPGKYKKKFLALSETGLKKDDFFVLGLDYLKHLGITHLQLLPVFDFDNDRSDYNWGYNPTAYNYLKKDYVYNQDDPYAYINEFRQTVNALHKNNIRVTLDVVFNHVYNAKKFDLGKMLKGKLYRYRPDGTMAEGSMCGSEIRSEDPFVRAYILEMVYRYLKIFDIDGIRMDLMGILDHETVDMLYDVMNEHKKGFLVYGEGWNMGDVLPEEERAAIPNARKMPGVMMFNDHFRDTIISYIAGNREIIEDVEKMIGADGSYLNHRQSLNFVECHDDYTFYDRMMLYKSDEAKELNEKRSRLALAIVLVSRGVPFIHMGEEFLRSKGGLRNSYNSGDYINSIDWDERVKHNELCDYFRDLIQIRKKYPVFNKSDTPVDFSDYYECLIYRIGNLMIIINPSGNDYMYSDGNNYSVIFDDRGACEYQSEILAVSAYSLVICRF